MFDTNKCLRRSIGGRSKIEVVVIVVAGRLCVDKLVVIWR